MPPHVQDNPIVRDNGSAPLTLRLEFLDGLRGLAALYVVVFHFSASRFLVDKTGARFALPLPLRALTAAMQYGHYAVAVFIVLSGYSLMLPIARARDGQLRGGFAGYLKRRAWRILPPYYAALMLSLVCLVFARQWQELDRGAVWSHLLLVHNLRIEWYAAINIPLWSVATEWDIYFIFPLLLLPLWRWWGMGMVFVAAFALGWLPHFAFPAPYSLNWACPWYIGLFSMGMGAATLTMDDELQNVGATPCGCPTGEKRLPYQWKVILSKLQPGFWSGLAAASALAFVAVAVCRPFWIEERQWILDPIIGLFAVFLILSGAAATLHPSEKPGLLLHILEHKWTQKLGQFSYSLYLTHILVKWGCYALLSHAALSPAASLLYLLGVGVPASLLVGWVFYLLVERRFLSQRAKERATRPAVIAQN